MTSQAARSRYVEALNATTPSPTERGRQHIMAHSPARKSSPTSIYLHGAPPPPPPPPLSAKKSKSGSSRVLDRWTAAAAGKSPDEYLLVEELPVQTFSKTNEILEVSESEIEAKLATKPSMFPTTQPPPPPPPPPKQTKKKKKGNLSVDTAPPKLPSISKQWDPLSDVPSGTVSNSIFMSKKEVGAFSPQLAQQKKQWDPSKDIPRGKVSGVANIFGSPSASSPNANTSTPATVTPKAQNVSVEIPEGFVPKNPFLEQQQKKQWNAKKDISRGIVSDQRGKPQPEQKISRVPQKASTSKFMRKALASSPQKTVPSVKSNIAEHSEDKRANDIPVSPDALKKRQWDTDKDIPHGTVKDMSSKFGDRGKAVHEDQQQSSQFPSSDTLKGETDPWIVPTNPSGQLFTKNANESQWGKAASASKSHDGSESDWGEENAKDWFGSSSFDSPIKDAKGKTHESSVQSFLSEDAELTDEGLATQSNAPKTQPAYELDYEPEEKEQGGGTMVDELVYITQDDTLLYSKSSGEFSMDEKPEVIKQKGGNVSKPTVAPERVVAPVLTTTEAVPKTKKQPSDENVAVPGKKKKRGKLFGGIFGKKKKDVDNKKKSTAPKAARGSRKKNALKESAKILESLQGPVKASNSDSPKSVVPPSLTKPEVMENKENQVATPTVTYTKSDGNDTQVSEMTDPTIFKNVTADLSTDSTDTEKLNVETSKGGMDNKGIDPFDLSSPVFAGGDPFKAKDATQKPFSSAQDDSFGNPFFDKSAKVSTELDDDDHPDDEAGIKTANINADIYQEDRAVVVERRKEEWAMKAVAQQSQKDTPDPDLEMMSSDDDDSTEGRELKSNLPTTSVRKATPDLGLYPLPSINPKRTTNISARAKKAGSRFNHRSLHSPVSDTEPFSATSSSPIESTTTLPLLTSTSSGDMAPTSAKTTNLVYMTRRKRHAKNLQRTARSSENIQSLDKNDTLSTSIEGSKGRPPDMNKKSPTRKVYPTSPEAAEPITIQSQRSVDSQDSSRFTVKAAQARALRRKFKGGGTTSEARAIRSADSMALAESTEGQRSQPRSILKKPRRGLPPAKATPAKSRQFSYGIDPDMQDPVQMAGMRLLSAAVVPIQTMIRGHQARTSVIARVNANRRNATILIQTSFRGWYVRDQIADQQFCATQIQRIVRGYIATVKVYESIYRVTLLQSYVRMKLATEEAIYRMAFIIQVQSIIRGYIERRELEKKDNAAFRIQTAFRCHNASMNYQFMLLDVITVQTIFRQKMAIKVVEDKITSKESEAASLIQTQWRSYDCSMNYLHLLADVLIVQSVARRFMVLRSTKESQSTRQNAAATQIQRAWRGFIAYSDFLFKVADIVVVQTRMRRWLANRELSAVRRVQDRVAAIITIQSIVRRFLVLKINHDARGSVERGAATLIQQHWRCYLYFSNFTIMLDSSIKIQAQTRRYIVCRKVDMHHEKARIIQKLGYKYLNKIGYKRNELLLEATSMCLKLGIHEERAANTIQKVIRGRQVRFTHNLFLTVRLIQKIWRGHSQFRSYKSYRNAKVIQSAWRGKAARQDYTMLRNSIKSAVLFQSAWRRYVCYTNFKCNRSAVKIQSAWRAFVCYTDYIFTVGDIVVAQCTVRRFLARLEVHTRREHKKCETAALDIQRYYRGGLDRQRASEVKEIADLKEAKERHHIEECNSIRIQTVARRYLALKEVERRKFFAMLMASESSEMRVTKASTTLQTWWRIQYVKIKEKKAAITIQSFFVWVKGEVDREIKKEQRKRKARKLRKRTPESDDEMLDNIWESTLESEVNEQLEINQKEDANDSSNQNIPKSSSGRRSTSTRGTRSSRKSATTNSRRKKMSQDMKQARPDSRNRLPPVDSQTYQQAPILVNTPKEDDDDRSEVSALTSVSFKSPPPLLKTLNTTGMEKAWVDTEIYSLRERQQEERLSTEKRSHVKKTTNRSAASSESKKAPAASSESKRVQRSTSRDTRRAMV